MWLLESFKLSLWLAFLLASRGLDQGSAETMAIACSCKSGLLGYVWSAALSMLQRKRCLVEEETVWFTVTNDLSGSLEKEVAKLWYKGCWETW